LRNNQLRNLETRFERLLFAARWLLAPLYAAMVLAVVTILVAFARELIGERVSLKAEPLSWVADYTDGCPCARRTRSPLTESSGPLSPCLMRPAKGGAAEHVAPMSPCREGKRPRQSEPRAAARNT
jgi:hypothetical protein